MVYEETHNKPIFFVVCFSFLPLPPSARILWVTSAFASVCCLWRSTLCSSSVCCVVDIKRLTACGIMRYKHCFSYNSCLVVYSLCFFVLMCLVLKLLCRVTTSSSPFFVFSTPDRQRDKDTRRPRGDIYLLQVGCEVVKRHNNIRQCGISGSVAYFVVCTYTWWRKKLKTSK